MVLTPKHEDINGSNLTGSSGATNRTYTLANSNAQAAGFVLIIENAALQQGIDYSLSSDVITFLNAVFDNQDITIDYLVSDASAGVTYTDTLQVARLSGLGVEIQNENVGTGDNSNKSFDLDNGNVISDSYTLKHSTTGDDENSFTTLVESTHYTIDKDGGSILLTSAGVTQLGTDVLYADYIHSPKISDTVIETYLAPASAETDKTTGNYWGPVKTTTDEVHDGRETNAYPETDGPYVTDYDDDDFIQLNNLSVQTITSIEFLTGTSSRTLDSDNYRFDEDGFITLLSDRLPLGRINVHVTYTHGYATTPDLIKELTAHYAAIRAFVLISGGSYDDATSYTLGRKAITIGEAWVNIREVIDQSKKRIKEILNTQGPKMDVV
jgi:hypothetical protein